jgi:hypothetical protein
MRLLVALLLALGCATAQAQVRTIPPDATRGTVRHLQEMIVQIDGERRRLAPGVLIRDAANRIVLPASLAQDTLVKFRLDEAGMVRQMWVLTPQEAAQTDAPKQQ